MTDKAYAVPLHELLAGVPRGARLVITDLDGMGTRFIPVGRYCHEAAEALRARLAQLDRKSFGEMHPRNPDAICKCEHWQSCAECHPTAHAQPERYTTDAMKVKQAVSEAVLQQAEQEPTAYLCENAVGHKYFRWKKPSSEYKPIALYTAHASPQRIWQSLTDKEYETMAEKYVTNYFFDTLKYAKAIEAKLKEKNT